MKWGLRATETEIAKWRVGIRDPQELVYSTRRIPFECCVVKADNRTAGAFGRSSRRVNINL
jgi:hypothetical protein